jgi:hypothetical protein
MTAYSWILGGGNWNNAKNWSPTGGPPTSGDSATIAAKGGTYSVIVDSSDLASSLTLSSADTTVNDSGASASLTIGGTLALSAGTLNVATSSVASGVLTVSGSLNLSGGALTVNAGGEFNLGGTLSQTGGTLSLRGGTIAGGTIDSTAGTLSINSGTLSGVTFDGPLNLTSSTVEQSVHLANGATVVSASGSGRGTIDITGKNSKLYFDNTQTVLQETIKLGNSDSYGALYGYDAAGAGNQVLTLTSSVTVIASGYAAIHSSSDSGDGIVNDGVIDQTSGTLQIAGNAFTNSGAIDAKGHGSVVIRPNTFTNTGAIDVGNGDFVTIASTTFTTTASSLIAIEANSSVAIEATNAWTNHGSITLASGGSLYLYGSASATNLGSTSNSGGTVYIAGTYNNSGQTLDGSAPLGQFGLCGGAIRSGTATSAGVAFTAQGGTLSGLTLEGPLNLTSTTESQSVDLANGAKVVGPSGSGPGMINVTGYFSTLYFDNTQTVSNETTTLGNSSGYTDALYGYDTTWAGNQVLTLASSVTVNVVGDASISSSYASGDAIVNQGLIDQSGNYTLEIAGSAFTNSGEIQLGDGTLIGASASLTNAAGSTLQGFGTVTAETFTNSGIIEASGGTLTLTNTVTGTGGLQIDGAADLVVGGSIASGATAAFNGASAMLTLEQPSSFGATVGGIGAGDTFDLMGVTANGATVNGSNQLLATENGTTVDALQLSGTNSGFRFVPVAVIGHLDRRVAGRHRRVADPCHGGGLSGGSVVL